ncbi:hypothetical protein C4610_07925 [Enterococcus hirae]|nr:hypothetical protein C4611_07925 [Enterococcus hirae]PPF00971.1 hypothetical protein C4610_07925 [Enterococcus hirae]
MAEKLIKELYRKPSTYRLGRFAEFMFLTGTHIGKAIEIQAKDFDFENSQAFVNGSIDRSGEYRRGIKGSVKTNASYRNLDITNRTLCLVKRTIEEVTWDSMENDKFENLNYLFVTKNGIPVQNNSFNLALKRADERVDLAHKIYHLIFFAIRTFRG